MPLFLPGPGPLLNPSPEQGRLALDAAAVEAIVPLETAAATSTATLALTAETKVVLGQADAVSSATLALTAPAKLTLGQADAVSAATLTLTAPAKLTLETAAGVSSATLALTAPAKVVLETAAAQSAATCAVTIPTTVATVPLETAAAVSSASALGLYAGITYVATGTAAAGADVASLTPALPAGLLTGDVVLVLAAASNAVALTAPGGYTQLRTPVVGTGASLGIWGKVYVPGDTDPTVGFASGATKTAVAQCAAWRGLDLTVDQTGTSGGASGVQDIGPIAGITTTSARSLILVMGARRNNPTSIATLSGDSLTWNEIGENKSSAGAITIAAPWDYAIDTGTTAVTAKTFTVTGGSTANWVGYALNLKAGGAAPLLSLAAAAVSSATLALTAPAKLSLGQADAVSVATLALAAPARVTLATSAAVSSATLALTAPTRVVLETAAAQSAATLTVFAPSGATVPLVTAAAVSSATLALTAPTRVVLQTSAVVSAGTLALTAQTRVTLQSSAAVLSATLALTAVPRVALGSAAIVSSATLTLTARPTFTLQADAVSSATLALTARTYVVAQTATAVSAATLALYTPGIPFLVLSAAGVSSATLAVFAGEVPDTHPDLAGIFDELLTGGVVTEPTRSGDPSDVSHNGAVTETARNGTFDESLTGAAIFGTRSVLTTEPDTISGLTVWLDASQLGLADGAAVSPWPDLSGSGHDGNIVGSPAPTFRANTLNDLPVVRFNANEGRVRGSNGLSTGLVAAGGPGTYNFTVCYVGRMRTSAVGRIFTALYPGANYLIGFHTSAYEAMYDAGWVNVGTAYPAFPTPWKIYGADGIHDNVTYLTRFLKDGVESGTATTGGGMSTGYNLSGYSAAGTEETCDCDVAELVIYDRKLSEVERQTVEGYLRAKWLAAPAEPPVLIERNTTGGVFVSSLSGTYDETLTGGAIDEPTRSGTYNEATRSGDPDVSRSGAPDEFSHGGVVTEPTVGGVVTEPSRGGVVVEPTRNGEVF